MKSFKVEEIFQDIPGDNANVNFKIPPEIMKEQGWAEGDKIKISWGDKGTIIIEKVDDSVPADDE